MGLCSLGRTPPSSFSQHKQHLWALVSSQRTHFKQMFLQEDQGLGHETFYKEHNLTLHSCLLCYILNTTLNSHSKYVNQPTSWVQLPQIKTVAQFKAFSLDFKHAQSNSHPPEIATTDLLHSYISRFLSLFDCTFYSAYFSLALLVFLALRSGAFEPSLQLEGCDHF